MNEHYAARLAAEERAMLDKDVQWDYMPTMESPSSGDELYERAPMEPDVAAALKSIVSYTMRLVPDMGPADHTCLFCDARIPHHLEDCPIVVIEAALRAALARAEQAEGELKRQTETTISCVCGLTLELVGMGGGGYSYRCIRCDTEHDEARAELTAAHERVSGLEAAQGSLHARACPFTSEWNEPVWADVKCHDMKPLLETVISQRNEARAELTAAHERVAELEEQDKQFCAALWASIGNAEGKTVEINRAVKLLVVERDKLTERVAELEERFRHNHVSHYDGGSLTEKCEQCGLNMRDEIHIRVG